MAQGIFADLISDNGLHLRMCWESSSLISLAETILLRSPDAIVAMIFNCTKDPLEFRAPIDRIFVRTAPQERWHVALAVPDMTVWVLSNPGFASYWKEKLSAGRPSSKQEIANQFKDWIARGNRIDRQEIARQDSAFAALNRFIEQHVLAPAGQ
jgi:hypothetical protein